MEQEESVRRQLNRAQLAAKHNTRVLDAGAGDLWELRPTDVDDAKCRRRYDVFKVSPPIIMTCACWAVEGGAAQ